MKTLVLEIIKKMVNHPDEVIVSETLTENGKRIINIKVSSQDLARVIGKDGRVFKALRSIVTLMGPGNIDIVLDSQSK